MTSKEKIAPMLHTLQTRFPNKGAMEIGNSYQTLVGVILSARTRDEQVLKLLPEFFEAFPTPMELARASEVDIREKIKTIGMFRMKARNLKKMAERVVAEYGGKIPQTMEELVTLGGVGRKSASVLLVANFDQPAIAVDTHVFRVTNRLGFVKTKTPEQTERALLAIIPKKLQPTVNRVMVKFGRYICIPGRPRCWACPVRASCAFAQKNLTRPRNAEDILSDITRRERELEHLRLGVVSQ